MVVQMWAGTGDWAVRLAGSWREWYSPLGTVFSFRDTLKEGPGWLHLCILCAETFYNVLKGIQAWSGLHLVDFRGFLSLTKLSIWKDTCKKQVNEDNIENKRVLILTKDDV